MRESLLDLLQCPSGCDPGLNLTVESRTGDEIESGLLTCAGCRGIYCIREGIACLLPESLASPNGNPSIRTPEWAQSADDSLAHKRSEMAARDAQVANYDRMWYLNLFGLAEVPATLAQLKLAPEHLLMEAGSGTGRMTREFAARCRSQVSVDFSYESLRA